MPQRKFDIVLWGLTGLTGTRCGDHIKRARENTFAGLKVALAGRNADKIKKEAEICGIADLPIIVADASNQDSIEAMCAQTKVIASAVGPYTLYGTPIVEACVKTGTHYCDITGEFPWVARYTERLHEEAVKKGVWLLSMSAFDSLPVLLTNKLIHQHAQDRGMRIEHVTCAWSLSGGGGLSGGTVASGGLMGETLTPVEKHPLSLLGSKQLEAPPKDLDISAPAGGYPEVTYPWPSALFQGYTGAFLMSSINTKCVRKSNVLHGYKASYLECMRMSSLLQAVIMYCVSWLILILQVPILSGLIRKYLLPKPGEGPTRDAEKDGKFAVFGAGFDDVNAINGTNTKVRCLHTVPYPGYPATAIYLMETAACLAKDEINKEATKRNSSWSGGGSVTPDAVVSDALIRRLTHYGMHFYVGTAQSWKQEDLNQVL